MRPEAVVYRPPPDPLTPLLLDDNLVVVDKPAGLLSVPGRGDERADCALSRVRAYAPDAQTVHRLDMATSGLLVFGRGPDMQRALSRAFMHREVDKRYVAEVLGRVEPDQGRIDLPLITDWPNRPRQKVDTLVGKPSLTRWTVLARGEGRTRLELEPVTGRSHQLRVHLAAIGHPICGDELYGPGDDGCARMHLHARWLRFAHPRHGGLVEVSSTVPF